MSLSYLREAVATGDREKLIRYVRLHFGDGNDEAGKLEIEKAWIEALKLLLELPPTDRVFIDRTLREQSPETLAHLFFNLHFYLVRHSGEWIHDGEF
ncbi:MAG: hypothetical protein ABIS03_00135 [Gemmatimonadaceae bacterium]